MLGEVSKLSETILTDLKEESVKKADIEGLKSGIIQRHDEDSDAIKEFGEKSHLLIRGLDGIKEQLIKAKKDNLCIRISYERWKQAYDSLELLKSGPLVENASTTVLTEI
jgi:hypothetical protein